MWRELAFISLGLVGPALLVAGAFLLLRASSGPLEALLDRVTRPRVRTLVTAGLMLLPATAILAVFAIGPLVYALVLSLYDSRRGVGPYVRFGNYVRAVESPEFWNSVHVTLWYALLTVPITMLISFLVADRLFRLRRLRGVFRTAFFLPYVTSTVAAAMVWRLFFQPRFGIANALLEALGLQPNAWLLEPRGLLYFITGGRVGPEVGPSMALCCIVLFDIWHSSGFMIVIMLAGLAAVPKELEDAARIDGANWLQKTRNVVIPLLSPTLFFLAVISLIRAFQAFNSFYALADKGRGPGNTTQSLTVYVYSLFEFGRWGYGSAVATLLALAIMILTIVQWRVLGRKVHYE